MRFNSEEKRLQHPQAGLIPKDIWEDFFSLDREFTPVQIDLMSKSLNDLKQNPSILNKKINKREAWLAIYYGHPNASASDLIDIGKLLGNLPRETFQHAAMVSSLEVINQLLVGLTPDEVQEMIAAKD